MRAIVMHEHGGPEVLRLEDVPEPVPGAGQVLLRVEAAGVSYHETAMRAGVLPMIVPLPAVFGFEAAGTVMAVGEGTDPGLIGQRVVALDTSHGGMYAERVAVPASAITTIPEALSSADAVAFAVQGSVALALCVVGQGQHEETVLVEVASGLIGGYVTQLMRAHGVRRIVATAGGAAKRDLALKAGADVVLDHTDPDWPDQVAEAAGGTVDLAFTSIGGATTARYLDAMTPGTGRILLYGLLAGLPDIAPIDLMTRGLTLTGCAGTGWMERVTTGRSRALALAVDGMLTPSLDRTFALEDAAEAHRHIESRAGRGKLVLVP
ncbi:quinone oxidoreductase family protein [Pseudonocardia sp. CA-142604]|uniref:quinone oxidoreductase family protein n=1 Tax=Pseudonocardia sp. CA-142604 TaxID=3240024 RepID=UPI003D8E7732